MAKYMIIYTIAGEETVIIYVEANEEWKVYYCAMDSECKKYVDKREKFDKDGKMSKRDIEECECAGDPDEYEMCDVHKIDAYVSWDPENNKLCNYKNALEYFYTPGQGFQYGNPGKEWFGIEINEYEPPEFIKL